MKLFASKIIIFDFSETYEIDYHLPVHAELSCNLFKHLILHNKCKLNRYMFFYHRANIIKEKTFIGQ